MSRPKSDNPKISISVKMEPQMVNTLRNESFKTSLKERKVITFAELIRRACAAYLAEVK